MSTLGERIRDSWNVFRGRESIRTYNYGYSTSTRPDRPKLSRGNERSMVNAIYNRIAVDVASIDIKHVVVDENERFLEEKKSGLNNVLTNSANLDQTGRTFIQDAVISMFDEGCVALVPIETSVNPNNTDSYDIYTMRTGKIVEWYPKNVKVNLYDERVGKRKDIILEKEDIAIVENPFYSIMNEPNSTLQRLIRILNNIDRTNDQNSAGKVDLIIKLPYLVKSESKRAQAEERRKMIENQLSGAQYGIAYIDGTENITQLNRSLENNLWQQAQDLKQDVYNQLGLTEDIFNGKANEQTMLDYYTRTIEPILVAISEELERKFITKTARTQGQRIKFFREPFKLVPVNDIAKTADVLSRNEVLSSNEIRSILGFKPDMNPKSDQLINSNMPYDQQMMAMNGEVPPEEMAVDEVDAEEANADKIAELEKYYSQIIDDLEKQINEIVENYLSDSDETEEE